MARLTILLLLGFALGGCGAQHVLLGTGSEYILTTNDALVLPGETVSLRASLEAGDLLDDQPGLVILFRQAGQPPLAAQTNVEGLARFCYRPPTRGDYLFKVGPSPNGFATPPPPDVPLLLTCRDRNDPLVICDIDGTLTAGSFAQVLLGSAAPLPHSPEVLRRLASQNNTIVYLTHRPEYFQLKTRGFLENSNYPQGPLLMTEVGTFVKGSYQAKINMLQEIRKKFANIRYGIGNTISDARAYGDMNIQPILLLDVERPAQTDELVTMLGNLAPLRPDTQVVTDWKQVEQVIFEGRKYPVEAARDRLSQRLLQSINQPASPATTRGSHER